MHNYTQTCKQKKTKQVICMIFLRRELEKRNHENTRNAENFHHFKFPSLRTTQEPGASHALFSMPNALEGLSELFGLPTQGRTEKIRKRGGGRD